MSSNLVVLLNLHDKSISSILSYILKSKNITPIEYSHQLEISYEALKNKCLVTILDNDLPKEEIEHYLTKNNFTQCQETILLAISKDYKDSLTTKLHPKIKGIIYKPFDIEDLLDTVLSTKKIVKIKSQK